MRMRIRMRMRMRMERENERLSNGVCGLCMAVVLRARLCCGDQYACMYAQCAQYVHIHIHTHTEVPTQNPMLAMEDWTDASWL